MASRSDEFDGEGRDLRTHIIRRPDVVDDKGDELHPWGRQVPDLVQYVREVDYYTVLSEYPFIFARRGGGIWMLIEVSYA